MSTESVPVRRRTPRFSLRGIFVWQAAVVPVLLASTIQPSGRATSGEPLSPLMMLTIFLAPPLFYVPMMTVLWPCRAWGEQPDRELLSPRQQFYATLLNGFWWGAIYGLLIGSAASVAHAYDYVLRMQDQGVPLRAIPWGLIGTLGGDAIGVAAITFLMSMLGGAVNAVIAYSKACLTPRVERMASER